LADLVKLSMGADVELDKVELTIKGVEAQVLLKVRLEQVRAILDKALTTIGENPEILQSLVQTVDRTLGEVGGAAREAVGEGRAVSQLAGGVGDAAEQAVGQVGQTANRAVGQVTQQAGRLLEERVNEAGQTVQWVVGESGSVVERTLNDSGKVLNEAVVDDASNPGSEGEHSWSECSRRRHGKEEHPMWTKRAGDLIGAFVVGNGVLDLIAPRQRVFLLDLRTRTLAQARPLVCRSPHSDAFARHSENRNRHMVGPKAVSGSSPTFLLAPTLVPQHRLAEYRLLGSLLAPLGLVAAILLITVLYRHSRSDAARDEAHSRSTVPA
jgi:hypothetical protein